MKIKKRKILVSILTTIFLTTILFNGSTINAIGYEKNQMVEATEPFFDVVIDSTTINGQVVNSAAVGQDITVNGRIIPKPFKRDVAEKEIVLVLDTSASMSWDSNIECKENILDILCIRHLKSTEHYYSRMEELKSATKSFLNKVKDIPNLKVAVITFSKYADVKTKNENEYFYDITNKYGSDVNEKLLSIVNNLSANDGTNTGEGLRKAAYLLNEKKDCKKSIVLMTDGVPTFRTEKENRYYEDINSLSGPEGYNSIEIAGNGMDENDEKNLDYAVKIGEKINAIGNISAYSIGYGLDDKGAGNLGKIHSSMIGREIRDFSTCEEDGMYLTSNSSIEKLFNKIADNILAEYGVEKLELQVSTSENFVTNIEGNKVEIPNIEYKYSSLDKDNKAIYKADPVEFSFIIKGNSIGENQEIFKEESKLKYIFENEEKNINVNLRRQITLNKMDNDKIRILEIEPADSFKITSKEGRVKTGAEETIINLSDGISKKVIVQHTTMPEFIGKAEKVNGKYDVIVIGRYVDSSFNNVSNNEDKQQYKYRDYFTNRKDQENEENDITNLKSKEIIDFINSGQLAYCDSNIISNPYNNNKIDGSKLYRNFIGKSNDNRVDKINGKNFKTNESVQGELTLNKIIQDYVQLEGQYKGVNIELNTYPIGDSDSSEFGNPNNRNMQFDMNISNNDGVEDVNVDLYLDINGDGLFKESELVSSQEDIKIPVENFKFNYQMDEKFIGNLDWKIEVTRKGTSIKTYETGSVLFRRLNEKKVINVLQIVKDNEETIHGGIDDKGNKLERWNQPSNKYEVLDLSTNNRFQELLKEIKDYDIKIKTVNYQTVNKIYNSHDYENFNEELKRYIDNNDYNKIKNLNGNYNMIIMGFKDSYGGENHLSDTVIGKINDFINTGQGLMLTHDTLFYNYDNNYAELPKTKDSYIDNFRYIIGQSRYKLSDYKDKYDVPCFDVDNKSKFSYWNSKVDNNIAMGATLWLQSNSNKILDTLSTEVNKINESLITKYPFTLDNTISIRRTHGQYLQLNLEDEDVIPWFTFTNNNKGSNDGNDGYNGRENSVNKYDVRNNYYTYSRKNITFSGTGEETREYAPYPDSELKLFINTIIKAERGANHAPIITALTEDKVTEVPQGEDFSFDTIVKDIDNDKVKINKVSLEDKDIIKCESNYSDSGYKKNIILSKNYLSHEKELTLKIQVQDDRGAITEKVYKIKPVKEALITADNLDIKCLNGDVKPFEISLKRVNDEEKKLINGMEVSLEQSSGLMEISNLELIDDKIIGTIKSKSNMTNERLVLKLNYKNNIGYKETKVNLIVSSKEGKVKVNITDINDNDVSDIIKSVKLNDKMALINKGAKEYAFNYVQTGEYKLAVDCLSSYKLIDSETNKDITSGSETISLDYNHNEVVKKYKLLNMDFKHGIYLGYDQAKNDYTIDENIVKFAQGSTVTFAGKTEIGKGDTEISLKLASGIELEKDTEGKEVLPRIYVIGEGGKISLKTPKEIMNKDRNEYKCKLKLDDNDKSSKIIVIYNALLPSKDGTYTNTLNVNSQSKDAKIEVYSDTELKGLPDLF